MDTVITGEHGTVSFGAVPTAIKLTKFTIKKSAAPINVSDNSSNGFADFVPAKLVEWTGTISGFLRKGVQPPAFNTVVDFTGTTEVGDTYAGKIILSEESTDVDTVGGNAVQVNRNFQGTGVLTETHQAA